MVARTRYVAYAVQRLLCKQIEITLLSSVVLALRLDVRRLQLNPIDRDVLHASTHTHASELYWSL